MAYSQQINQEQEALAIKNKSAELLSFSDRANQYRKHHLKDDGLERANKPKNATDKTLIMGEKAQKLLAVFRGKFRGRRKELVLNDKYIAEVTKLKKRQNINIINQIPDSEFIIKRNRKQKSYVITKAKNEESSLQNFAKSEMPKSPANKRAKADNSIYKNNSSKRTRSNARAHEAKFLQRNNSNNLKIEFVENTETKKLTTEFAKTKALVSKKKIKSNARKKPTAAERKANRANIYKFNQYEKPKNLAEHYPLSQEDCYELQKRSAKAYNLNAMNEILLDMSRKPELQGNSFVSKAKFMAYMTKTYHEEGRDVDKANSPTFKIMKRRPQAEIEEIVTLNQREKYLNQVENSGIHARCDYTQLRARIAGQFPINLAYTLLTSMIGVKRQENVLKLTMHKQVTLSQHYKQLLLKHATGVGEYAGVSELEFVGIASNSHIAPELSRNGESQTSEISQSTVVPDLVQREKLQLPEGNWGKVCSVFISQQEHGESHYQNWLAGLVVTEDIEVGIIQLRTSSDMVRDRIEQTYLPFLSKVADKFGIKEIILGLKCNILQNN